MRRLIGKRKMVRKLLALEQPLISHLKIDQGYQGTLSESIAWKDTSIESRRTSAAASCVPARSSQASRR